MTVTLEEKIEAVACMVAFCEGFGEPASENVAALRALLADLRAWRKLEPETTQATQSPPAVE